MKEQNFEDALGAIDEELVRGALSFDKTKKRERHTARAWLGRRKFWAIPVAAVLVICIALGIFLSSGESVMRSYAMAEPEYPDIPKRAGVGGTVGQTSDEWRNARWAQYDRYKTVGDSLESFYSKTVSAYLGGADGENLIYSPTSAYLALAMLAECSSGTVRDELTELLGVSPRELATVSEALFLSTYWDDGKSVTKLSSSLWLDEERGYDERITKLLAEKYYATSFRGKFGTAAYNDALGTWLKRETNGLLKTDGVGFKKETALAIATSIYFEASWTDEFVAARDGTYLFTSKNGSVTDDFLKRTEYGTYFYAEKYSAVSKSFRDGGAMHFILPDEGISPEELMGDAEALRFISSGGKEGSSSAVRIHLAVPRFDVESRGDLSEMLSSLGVTAAFRPSESYPIFSSKTEAMIDKILHDARVAIDEEGCIAAAYTVITMDGTASAPPDDEVYFTVDRPFIFMITSNVGAPIFVGIINNI